MLAEIGSTKIVVTRDPAEAMLLADEIVLLEEGRVLQSGPVETVFARPASKTAARLLGADAVAAGQAVAAGLPGVGGVRIGGDWYAATIPEVGPLRAGHRVVGMQFGHTTLQAMADPGQPVAPGPSHVSIDPAAIQVRPT